MSDDGKPRTPRGKPRPRRVAVVAPPAAPFQAIRLPAGPAPRHRIEQTLPLASRVLVPLLLFCGALLILGTNLQDPPSIVFDEAHYIHWSREIARGNLLLENATVQESPVNYEHPPLAKFLMAASYRIVGAGQLDLSWPAYEKGCAEEPPCPPGRDWQGCNEPRPECRREAFAWRLPSLLIGASAVPAVYLLALRLFNSLPAGLFAGALLLLDNLWYLHSRLAMLDVFAAAFAVWAFALVLGRGRAAPWLGSIALGAAVSSKYTAVFLVPIFLLAAYFRTRPGAPWKRTLKALGFTIALPFSFFVVTYAPFIARWSDEGFGTVVQRFILVQIAALGWDFAGTFDHTSASAPWSWVPHTNPTFYYWPGYETFTQTSHLSPPFMYAVGNAALWWPATAALILVPLSLAVWWIARRARHYLHTDVLRALPRLAFHLSPTRSLAVAALLFWASYAPWFLLQRTTFNYYATFNVPYFALFAAGLLHFAWRTRARPWAVAYLGLAGAWFTAWWPIVSGAPVSMDHFTAVWDLAPWMAR